MYVQLCACKSLIDIFGAEFWRVTEMQCCFEHFSICCQRVSCKMWTTWSMEGIQSYLGKQVLTAQCFWMIYSLFAMQVCNEILWAIVSTATTQNLVSCHTPLLSNFASLPLGSTSHLSIPVYTSFLRLWRDICFAEHRTCYFFWASRW